MGTRALGEEERTSERPGDTSPNSDMSARNEKPERKRKKTERITGPTQPSEKGTGMKRQERDE